MIATNNNHINAQYLGSANNLDQFKSPDQSSKEIDASLESKADPGKVEKPSTLDSEPISPEPIAAQNSL